MEAIWGFRLQHFQAIDLEKLLSGGIYSLMYPTDYGKSTLIEMCVVLGLMLDPNRRFIVIKINESAALECADELAKKLLLAFELTKDPRFKPVVSFRNGQPWGVGRGFWIGGAIQEGRNLNRSVHVYALGSRDLQGKRGPTLIDDVETQEEANSMAMRIQLEKRLSAVMRTLENRPDALWAILGTPYHETSIHFDFVTKLRGLGLRYEEIRRTPLQADGTPLWPSMLTKMETHRRLMSKTEFAAAYELRPVSQRRFDQKQIESLRDRSWPLPRDEHQFRAWILEHFLRQKPDHRDAEHWEREVRQRLLSLEFYIGWDPATTGDWANCAIAILGRQTYVLRTQLAVGDVWEQATRIKLLFSLFPSSSVVIEKNAQQKAFRDVFEKACPEAPVFSHGTYSNKEAPMIGMTAFASDIREGYLHLPWADDDRSEDEFSDLVAELERYGPTAHPHIIAAMWFCWYWAHQHEIDKPARRIRNGEPEPVQRFQVLRSANKASTLRSPELIKRSHAAWNRHRQ